MRDLPLLLVLIVLLVFFMGVFTDAMPPGISDPARMVYNECVGFVNSLARAIGMGAGSEYFILLPRR